MKQSNIGRELLLWIIMLAPLAYLGMIWNLLPDTIPIHFDYTGTPDDYGSKMTLFWMTLLLPVGTYGIMSLVMAIDPKQKMHKMGNKFWTLKLLIVGFIAALTFMIVRSTYVGSIETKWMFGLISFFFVVLGNYLQTVPPNYFIGIRTPWTLENDEVWKKTHRFCGRIMMVIGAIMFLLVFFLPPGLYFGVFMAGVIAIALVPFLFSYQKFKEVKEV